MNFRALLTAGTAIAAVAAAAFAAPGLAGTAATASDTAATGVATLSAVPSVHVPGLRIHVVNLHQQFARALAVGQKRVITGPEAGVVPMLSQRGPAAAATVNAARAAGAATPASTAARSCTEPNCDVSRHGGAVQHSPHVYLLLWGPDWSSSSKANSVANYLTGFYYGLGQASYDSWSTITSQYKDTTGRPAFGKAVLDPSTDVFNDPTKPPSTVTHSDIASEALSLVSKAHITDTADAQVVVASQAGTCFSDGFAGNCGTLQSNGYYYCGWHSAAPIPGSSAYLPYVNLPWQLDAGFGCGANFVNGGSAGLLDGWSIIGGHEYAETVTDPNPSTGYIDANDETGSGGEIADKCVWGGEPFYNDPFGDITLPIGTNGRKVVSQPFAMQSLWSNAAGRCVMTTSPTLYIPTPPTQKSVLGKAVSLQLSAKTNTGLQSSYKATRLPPGLSIKAGTGKITGKPSVTAGTFKPKVTISDYAKSVTISFTWQVSSAAGAVKGYDSKCVDDSAGSAASGNKIDIWSCTGKAPQQVTFAANRELQVRGKCVTGGKTAFLEPCRDGSNQAWTRLSNGEYVLAATGKCLTDPSNSRANGTWLTLAACKNTASQHWSLP